MKRHVYLALAILFGALGIAHATNFPTITQAVAVCDPNFPSNCLTPGVGGATSVSIADGADVAEGAKADAAYVSGSGSVVSILKGIFANTAGPIPAGTSNIGIVTPYAASSSLVSGVTAAMTGTTSTSLIAAPAGGLRNYVTHIACTNSHATVGTFVLVQDGSGGTTIYEGYAAAVGGGFSFTMPAPLRQPTTATALFVQNVTTGSNVICAATGYSAT